MSKIVAARVAAGNPVIRVYLEGTDGAAEPDLTFGSSGLKIEYQRELSSSATVFSGSNLEDITTIGTYAAPTSGKARFKEMSGTTLQGWYEIHLPQAAVGTADASRFLVGMVSGVTGLRDCPFEIELVPDAIPNDSTQLARVSDVSGLATAASVALLQVYPKNTAISKFGFAMYLTDGTLATGVTIAGTISKDGGNFASITDSPAEIQTSGCYEVDLTQTEANADEILLKFTGTGCVPLVVKLRTQA